MTKIKFTDELVKAFRVTPGVIDANVKDITKNNNTNLAGIAIKTTTSGKYAAVVYVDDLYNDFVNGESIEDIVKNVMKACNTHTPASDFGITDYDKIRPHLFMTLVNAELNKDNENRKNKSSR